MRKMHDPSDLDGLAKLDCETTKVLGTSQERTLLRELGQCKTKLAEALAKVPGAVLPEDGGDPQALAQFISQTYTQDGAVGAQLGAVYQRYVELRGKLALANLRLVAHVAKRFRDRGVSYSDLLQEGFCGLLEAIDRFDLNHETKLATYATWWIRQSMQRAVAGCAYPVRLSPRHLRQLAQNQDEIGKAGPTTRDKTEGTAEMIQRIHVATRPTVSLDATFDNDSSFSLLHTMSDPEGDRTEKVDTSETVARLMAGLRPREQEVLSLRFGIGGKPKLSLSQVGKVMEVSKERVRQIQDRALEKLRAAAIEGRMFDESLLAAV